MPLSLCIAGLGSYATSVLGDIHDMTDELELFFASRDLDKARRYCQTYGGAAAFGSYEDAVRDPRVEAVYFFTPHHLHLEHAMLAARHSKHVLMEKPIARTVAESREMIRGARDAGIRLMVAENCRFLPAVDKCKEIIARGEIGELRLVQIQIEGYSTATDWRTSAEMTGGGVFIDAGIHYVDIMVNIGGFPERVYAAKPPQVDHDREGEDGLVMTAHLPGRAVGLINYSSATAIRDPSNFVTISGTRGHLGFVPDRDELVVQSKDDRSTVPLPEARRGLRRMLSEFRACIREDREPAMSGEEALRDLAVVLATYQSADEGRAVPVNQP